MELEGRTADAGELWDGSGGGRVIVRSGEALDKFLEGGGIGLYVGSRLRWGG